MTIATWLNETLTVGMTTATKTKLSSRSGVDPPAICAHYSLSSDPRRMCAVRNRCARRLVLLSI